MQIFLYLFLNKMQIFLNNNRAYNMYINAKNPLPTPFALERP